jgi:hypothetical protein
MEFKLEENTILTSDQFNQYEMDIRVKSLQIFTKKCKGIDKLVKIFEDEITSKLEKKKTQFGIDYSKKVNAINQDINQQFNEILNTYKEKMNETLETLCGRNEFNRTHMDLKKRSIESLKRKYIAINVNYLNPFMTNLELEINKSFIEITKNYEMKIQELNYFYDCTIEEAIVKCFVVYII